MAESLPAGTVLLEPDRQPVATPDADLTSPHPATTPDLFPKNPQLKFVRGVVGLSITFWTALLYTLVILIPMTPLFRLAFLPLTFKDPRTSRPGELLHRRIMWWGTVLLSAPLGLFCAVSVWATCRALWWRWRWHAKGIDIKGSVARPGTWLSLEAGAAAVAVHCTILFWLFYPDAEVIGYPLPNFLAVPAGIVMLAKAHSRHRSPILNPLKLNPLHPVTWNIIHGTALLIIALIHPTLGNPSPLLSSQLSETDLRRTKTAAEWLAVIAVYHFVTSLQADVRTVDWAVDKVREVVGREAEKLGKEMEEEQERRRRLKGKRRADDPESDGGGPGGADAVGSGPTEVKEGGELLEITLRTLTQSSPERVVKVSEAAVEFITRGRLALDDTFVALPTQRASELQRTTNIPVANSDGERPSTDTVDAVVDSGMPITAHLSTETHDTFHPDTPIVEHASSDTTHASLDPSIPASCHDVEEDAISAQDIDVPILSTDTTAPSEYES